MNVEKLPVEQAVGHILVHNHVNPAGQRIIRKGQRLTAELLPALQAAGVTHVYAAILAPDDVPENEAANRIGQLLAGHGLQASPATTGRVNLVATVAGVLHVDVSALHALNDNDGIALAVLPRHTVVAPKTIVGTLKIIPYALPNKQVQAVEAWLEAQNDLITVAPFVVKQAVLIVTGSDGGRKKVVHSFSPALRERLAAYGVTMTVGPSVPEDEAKISQALQKTMESGTEMILIAGETSITDVDDITPRAIKSIGGHIVHYGVPADPGNLMLLARKDNIPVVGVPGCARSQKFNVVDMVLPRLATGEQLTRRDLVELGHGGLLK